MKQTRVWRRAALAAALLAALAGFLWFENHVIETEEIAVVSARLPAAFDGFRIVQVSDLHGKAFGGDGERLLSAVRALEPDLIAITGDLADRESDLDFAVAQAAALAQIAPAYFVTGNHEWTLDAPLAFLSRLETAGVTVLRNEFLPLARDGETIVLAGAGDPNGPRDQKPPERLMEEIRAAHGDAFVLLLYHRNDRFADWCALGADVVLSGHGHGGVIRLPFVGGLIGVDREPLPEYDAGLYAAGRTSMAVSRGLGNSVVDFRLFNRPHLPVITLKTAA